MLLSVIADMRKAVLAYLQQLSTRLDGMRAPTRERERIAGMHLLLHHVLRSNQRKAVEPARPVVIPLVLDGDALPTAVSRGRILWGAMERVTFFDCA